MHSQPVDIYSAEYFRSLFPKYKLLEAICTRTLFSIWA